MQFTERAAPQADGTRKAKAGSSCIDELLTIVGREWGRFAADTSELAVASFPDIDEIQARLSKFDFGSPLSARQVLEEVSDMLRRWCVHGTHPRYFGLFTPSVHDISVVADVLVALYNPQLARWSAAPAANEIERHVLSYLHGRIGFNSGVAHFTSGGMESNLTAVAVALANACPESVRDGLRALDSQPVFYLSSEAHPSFFKAASVTGLGRMAARTVPVDRQLRLDVSALRSMIRQDLDEGKRPFLVVGTAGSVAAGVVDDLREIARVSQTYDLWFHVDAAWGGGVLMSDRHRHVLAGIEQATSVSWDAHKWLSVPMGAGMFFCRSREPLRRAFHVASPRYVSATHQAEPDNYNTSLQWGRRFVGLKVFVALAHLGASGIARLVDHQMQMGIYLRDRLMESGWQLMNRSPLPVVCFTHPAMAKDLKQIEAVADAVNQSGVAWISSVILGDTDPALRACITSFKTNEDDVRRLVGLLNSVADGGVFNDECR